MRKLGLICFMLVACRGSSLPTPRASLPEPPLASAAPASPSYLLLEAIPDAGNEGLARVRELPKGETRTSLETLLKAPFLSWVLAVGEMSRAIALELCQDDVSTCKSRFDHPALFVIKPGGNHPRQGLIIEGGESPQELPEAWYVEIDPQRAATLIPHEYGHALMFQLLTELPEHPQILPHTTSAITDDVTAFSEGWGIHFETLAADQLDPALAPLRQSRHRDQFWSTAPSTHGDSFLPALDLLSYSQSYRRYQCIKDNCFAFLPRPQQRSDGAGATTADDIIARWTDSTYDPARLRSLPQMVASEGVVAALFYRLATSDSESGLPDPQRYARMLRAFTTLREDRLHDQAMVLLFLEELLRQSDPDERRRVARTALEVLHYTPMLADAATFYARLHTLGHVMDIAGARELLESRGDELAKAVDALVEDPGALVRRSIRELWLQHPSLKVSLAGMGLPEIPLVFDLNTAPIEFIRSIPGISAPMATSLVASRSKLGGFSDLSELAEVSELSKKVREQIVQMHIPGNP